MGDDQRHFDEYIIPSTQSLKRIPSADERIFKVFDEGNYLRYMILDVTGR